MKIAFLLRLDISKESGVLKKVANQLKIWKQEGHDVKLFAQTPSLDQWSGLDGLEVIAIESDESPNIKGLKKIITRFKSMGALLKSLNSWNPDIVFYRFTTYYPAVSSSMKRLTYVLEINTDDIAEYKTRFGKLKNIYHGLFRDKLLNKAKGMIFVTNELKDKFSAYSCPKIVVSNSIDFTEYASIEAPQNESPRFLFMGTPGRKWHGFEKLIEFGRLRPEYRIDLIGPSASDYSGVPKNVTLHGYLSSDKYQSIVEKADFAFGTLSLHEKDMEEACPLKVREYLAYGIPTIVGYRDTDFVSNENEMVLEIPNNSDNVVSSLEVIDDFVKQNTGKRVSRKSINHLDAQSKEKERLEFMKKILNS